MRSSTLDLTKQLIAIPSVTPNDCGCQDLILERLESIGFRAEKMRFGNVDNLWLKIGDSSPLVVFAGHTDVVPPGPIDEWSSDPFSPTIIDEHLVGRGAADMKSSIAAFIIAVENFLKNNHLKNGSIALLLTSDEEGPAIDGTKKVVKVLEERDELPDYCIVGEPTSAEALGDTLKNGRRGSLSGNLFINGIQGHVAYPHLAINPIHVFAPALVELTRTKWDNGNEFFPPTTFQIANISAGTGASNVIPGKMNVNFNLRFSPEITSDDIKTRIEAILKSHNLDYQIDWRLSGNPFLTKPGNVVEKVARAVNQVTEIFPTISTTGGTSDARFISKICNQVIEFGPVNKTIHQVNEKILLEDLYTLPIIYEKIIHLLLNDK